MGDAKSDQQTTTLPDRMSPVGGNYAGAFVKIILSTIGALFTALFSGIAGIPAGLGEMFANPTQAFASFLADLTSTFFGLVSYIDPSAISLDGYGVFSYLAGTLVLAMMLFAVVQTAEVVGGGSGD